MGRCKQLGSIYWGLSNYFTVNTITKKMNCPRCKTLVMFEDFGNGEWFRICNVCGHYSSQHIEEFHDDIPIFSNKENNPLGVVASTKGNYPYYTNSQRDEYIKYTHTIGYTFCDNGRWVYVNKFTGKSKLILTEKYQENYDFH